VRCHGIRSDSGLDSLIEGNRIRDIDSQKVVDGRIEHSGIEAYAPGQVRIVDNHLPTESIHCSSSAARSRGNSTTGVQGCVSQGDNP
jgi:hypothetical protein